ncbi:hypothetical protein [Aliikangiella sp. G2MR2-5]|uniref:hypothetical protein n=1 Tax=Aliikangiella sp. G2MR2-5 TaxID=2788943 RepID=UPI0018A8BD3F|nr:hypothetical protein [Aliikangiella sp. G2MR2-5]
MNPFRKPVLNKFATFGASLVVVLGTQLSVNAMSNTDLAAENKSTSKEVSVHRFGHGDRTLIIDGKVIKWEQLSKEQQDRIITAEKNLEAVEKKIQIDEKKVEEISRKMEERARFIEAEVEKLEAVTVQMESKEVSLRDLSRLSAELSEKVKVNEEAMREKEREMRKLGEEMEKLHDFDFTEIEQRAKELEKVVEEIAAEF